MTNVTQYEIAQNAGMIALKNGDYEQYYYWIKIRFQ